MTETRPGPQDHVSTGLGGRDGISTTINMFILTPSPPTVDQLTNLNRRKIIVIDPDWYEDDDKWDS